MRDDLTEVIMVVDRSGSMEPLRDDAIGGFNTFLDEQKKQPGHMNLTLVLFNQGYEIVFAGKSIQDVAPLSHDTYVPGGMTALLDALGQAINQTGVRLAAMEEQDRPSKVLLVVLTDGQENSSKEFTKAQISEMVKHQEEKHGWKIIFLSSDLNAVADVTQGPGAFVAAASAMDFAPSGVGLRSAYRLANSAVTSYRTTGDTGDLNPDSDEKN